MTIGLLNDNAYYDENLNPMNIPKNFTFFRDSQQRTDELTPRPRFNVNNALMKNNIMGNQDYPFLTRTISNPQVGSFGTNPVRKSNYSALASGQQGALKSYSALPTTSQEVVSTSSPNAFAMGMEQGAKNQYAKPAFKAQTSTPNSRGQNLLNFATSGQGQAFARGLLESSGYSATPVSFGQAIAQGMKYMSEYDKQSKEDELQRQIFEYQKTQDQALNNLKLLEITSKDGRTALAKDMADLYPNLTPGSPEYAEQALKLAQSKSGTYDSTKDFLKSDIGRVDKMYENVSAQKDVNAVYDRMLAIANNPDFESGKLAELSMPFKRLLVASGMATESQVENFTLQELFETEQSFITPRMRPPGSGASSDFEQKLYASASATLGKTRDVNRLILYARSTYGKLSEARTNFYDEYLRENQSLPLNKVNNEFDEYLRNNPSILGEIVGTQNIINSEEDFENLIKSGDIQAGDVFFMNVKGDDKYNQHQLFTQAMNDGVQNG